MASPAPRKVYPPAMDAFVKAKDIIVQSFRDQNPGFDDLYPPIACTPKQRSKLLEIDIITYKALLKRVVTPMLNDEITKLGERRNSEAPVYGLPLEILVIILKLALRDDVYASNDDLDDIKGYATASYYRDLIPLSSVCNKWRTVIRDTPSFWIPIQFDNNLRLSNLALERSQPHAVKVQVYHPDKNYFHGKDFIEVVSKPEVVRRWSSLGISLSEEKLWGFRAMLEIPTPCLETALVGVPDATGDPEKPVNLFGGDAPKLRALDLKNIPILWTATSWPMLRSLEIKFADIPLPSLEQVRHILTTSSLLEKLVFIDLPEFDAADPIPSRPIETRLLLPNLKVFKLLECTHDVLHTLITLVDAPDCSTLSLKPDDDEEEGWFSNNLIQAIAPITEKLQALASANEQFKLTLNEITLKNREDSGFDLGWKGGDTPGAVFCPLTLSWILDTFHAALNTGPVSLSFRHAFDFGVEESMTMVRTFFSRNNINELHLSFNTFGSDHLLQALSSPMADGRWPLHTVQNLTMEPVRTMDTLVEMLKQRYITDHDIPPPEPLKTLHLYYRPPTDTSTWLEENLKGCTVTSYIPRTYAEELEGAGRATAD